MPKKLTQEEAMKRVIEAHGDKYDLSKLIYTTKMGWVNVKCDVHGWFDIIFRDFTKPIDARGCQKCSKEKYLKDKICWNVVSKDDAEKRLVEAYKDIYVFDMNTYVSFSKDMKVNCPEHGDFYESPSNMCNIGKGCPECGKFISSKKRTKDVKTRKDEAILKYGDRYSYSEVTKTVSNKENFFITCNKHNNRFETNWNRHLVKDGLGGCPDCRKESMRKTHLHNTETFIAISKRVQKVAYDYSRAIYIDHKSLVEIGCYIHGFFWQRADKHKIGQGCPNCAKNGFRNEKPGNLYVLKDSGRVKVGITNRKVKTRLSEVNIGGGKFVLAEEFYYDIGYDCRKHETELLQMMRGLYKNTEGTFDGVTESFEDVDLSLVINFIKEKRKIDGKERES